MKNFTLTIGLLCCIFTLNAQIINFPGDQVTIQAGIDAASDGDTVLVSEDTYLENLNLKGKAITLASRFIMDGDTSHIRKTLINGSSASNPDTASVIYVPKGSDQTTVICGFTITGGKGTMDLRGETWTKRGGGIFIDETSCIVKHNLITENVIDWDFTRVNAAGIYAEAGAGKEIRILNNMISNNKLKSSQRTYGAGISIDNSLRYDCKIVIDSNTISGNIAESTAQKECSAGGINCLFGLPTAGECIISHNLIENNQLIGYEYGTYSGGIRIFYQEPGTWFEDKNPLPVITNNIIRNNTAISGGGGAIGIWTNWLNHTASIKVTPQPVIINNTVIGNISNGATGIFNWRSFPLVMNNIFWNTNLFPENLKELEHVPIPANGTNNGIFYAFNNDLKNGFIPDANDVYGGNINNNPGFVADTFLLAEGSPCIGRGKDSIQLEDYGYCYYAPENDYSHNPRPNPVDAYIDIGAIESDYLFPVNVDERPVGNFRIYPNPTNGLLNIVNEIPGQASIEISSVSGRLILRKEMRSNPQKIDLSDFSRGIYFITVRSAALIKTEKIIKL